MHVSAVEDHKIEFCGGLEEILQLVELRGESRKARVDLDRAVAELSHLLDFAHDWGIRGRSDARYGDKSFVFAALGDELRVRVAVASRDADRTGADITG
jgi:hypothetical protein